MRILFKLFLLILISGLTVLNIGCEPGADSPSVTPSAVPVTPGPAARLVFTIQPVGNTAGEYFAVQPAVVVEDAEGNLITGYRGLVTLGITPDTGSPRAHLFGGTTAMVADGRVEFKGLSIDKADDGYTLTASSGDLVPAVSLPFAILPGGPARLTFTVTPSGGIAGTPLTPNPEARVLDRYGNMVTDFNGPVTILASGVYEEYTDESYTNKITRTFSIPLYGTTTVNAVNGVARFTDVYATRARPDYILTAAGGSLEPASIRNVVITYAEPAALEFTVHPEGCFAGSPFVSQPKVAVIDEYGNVVNSARATVTISITPGSGTEGATLSGTNALVTEDIFGGVAIFTDLSIDLAGDDYTLTAASDGFPSATGQAFDVSAP